MSFIIARPCAWVHILQEKILHGKSFAGFLQSETAESCRRYALPFLEKVKEMVWIWYAHKLTYAGYGAVAVVQEALGSVYAHIYEIVNGAFSYVLLEFSGHMVLADIECASQKVQIYVLGVIVVQIALDIQNNIRDYVGLILGHGHCHIQLQQERKQQVVIESFIVYAVFSAYTEKIPYDGAKAGSRAESHKAHPLIADKVTERRI